MNRREFIATAAATVAAYATLDAELEAATSVSSNGQGLALSVDVSKLHFSDADILPRIEKAEYVLIN